MKTITAFNILAVLALAGSALAAPIEVAQHSRSDQTQAASKVVGANPEYAVAMHDVMANHQVKHYDNVVEQDPNVNSVKVTANKRESAEDNQKTVQHDAHEDVPDSEKKRDEDDDGDDGESEDRTEGSDDDLERRRDTRKDSVVNVHLLPDNATSGKNGVVQLNGKPATITLIQTPGNSENIGHLRVAPPRAIIDTSAQDVNVNVPSNPNGKQIPPGGLAKTVNRLDGRLAATEAGVGKEPVIGNVLGAAAPLTSAKKVINAKPIIEVSILIPSSYVTSADCTAGHRRGTQLEKPRRETFGSAQ